jgi:hypothetical protein
MYPKYKKMETNFTPKNAGFFCKNCDFKCFKQSDWERHVHTIKHLHRHEGNKMETLESYNNKLCSCICGKNYSSRGGLWKHKKKCNFEENNINYSEQNEIQELKEFMKYLMKENSEMKTMMIDVIKNGTHITNNTNNNNSHNKTFNLQVFLNETCKNAMNLSDFVNSLQLKLSDLENVGEVGYIEGISNIIIKNLNALDVTERPVHCTDKKRETMYVKDEDKWEKEDENKIKMHKMIKKISNKNIYLINEFREKYPDYKKCTSNVSDQFNKIIIESMGGFGDNDYEKEEKIIKKIAKEVLINKE